MSFDFDLIVIGAGSGGVRSSRLAAEKGKKVALIESQNVGGTCVNRGCVPKKLYMYASQFAEAFEDSKGYGWHMDGKATFNWQELVQHKNQEIDRLEEIYTKNLKKAGVELIYGRASFIDSHRISIDGKQEISAQHILIATGGKPFIPPIEGKEHILTSDDFFKLTTIPKEIVLIGGGYIAIEFASILNSLGVKVINAILKDEVLLNNDEEIRQHAIEAIRARGVDLRTYTTVRKVVALKNNKFLVEFDNGEQVEVDQILSATGRIANTDTLNLSSAGVELGSRGEIKVDEYSQTNVKNIYAVGDVTNRLALTPVAIKEGIAFIKTLYENTPSKLNYENIPTVIFSQPPIGSCGLTEEKAKEKYSDIETYVSTFTPMKNTLAKRKEKTMMKMIVDKNSKKVLGIHVCGTDAGEIIQGFAVAINMGATKEDFDNTVGIHPTSSEEFVTMK